MAKKIALQSECTQALIKNSKKAPFPAFQPPMLATLTKNYFSKKDWLYEQKFDGERCVAYKKNGIVTVYSRNGREINHEYPEIVRALEAQVADNFVIDGEIVAFDTKGVTQFQLLQGRINLQKTTNAVVPVYYCIFDVLYTEGYIVEKVPLYARKELLKQLLAYNKILLYTEHSVGEGLPLYKKACKRHEEGIMAKQKDGAYIHARSRNWLKFKCSASQELVIGGYTKPRGSRTNFGALLVGYYDNKKFLYAGKVGTGFSHETLSFLGKKLSALTTKNCPFTNYDGLDTNVFWVKPQLVAEFEFAQWTNAGKLRVGRYKGLRDDKNAKSVVRESF